MNLYFTCESWDTLKSLTLFITVKAIAKLNLGHCNKSEIEFQKISRCSSRSSVDCKTRVTVSDGTSIFEQKV